MSQYTRSFSDLLRPKTLDEFCGHEKWWKGTDSLLGQSIQEGRPLNLLFWGPPGTGKTSISRIYLSSFRLPFTILHPSKFQLANVKEILEKAENSPLFRPTLIFIDEIHRLTRPQQDILLKAMEEGSVCLIAATTENPSFVLSNALLSRLHTIQFTSLHEKDLSNIIEKALKMYPELSFSEDVRRFFIELSQGDARKLLSYLEPIVYSPKNIKHYEKREEVRDLLPSHSGSLVASGEGRYLLISALHKAVRGSDVNASLYWLARMLKSGEDPLYITRRLIRMSLEDIGLADPDALQVTLRAQECYKTLGSPEGDLALFEAVIYLALSPKSASCYTAMKKVVAHAEHTGHIPPPKHILNGPTKWMKEQGYGEGYVWDHDCDNAFSGQQFWPETLLRENYYDPVERGFERELSKRKKYFTKLFEEHSKESDS